MSNKWRTIFIAVASVIVVTVIGAIAASRQVTTLNEEGYAVPASAGIVSSLTKNKDNTISMVELQEDEKVFASVVGWYVGESRKAIDKLYPLYINDGTALRFLNDSNWLIAPDLELLQSYEGLYLSGGTTYSSDREKADLSEFILLTLDNGLYMNAENAVFTNQIGTYDIPVNSIICFDKEYVRWYSYDTGCLVYNNEESVFDATITIGKHKYDYQTFLKSLAIVDDAIAALEKNKNADEILEEAIEFAEDPYILQLVPIIAGEILENNASIYTAQELSYLQDITTKDVNDELIVQYINEEQIKAESADHYFDSFVIPEYSKEKKSQKKKSGWYEDNTADSAAVSFKARHVLIKETSDVMPNETFEYTITEKDGTREEIIAVVENDGEAIVFPEIILNETKTYTYVIAERAKPNNSIQYSLEKYTVYVAVEENSELEKYVINSIKVYNSKDVLCEEYKADPRDIGKTLIFNVGEFVNKYNTNCKTAVLQSSGTAVFTGNKHIDYECQYVLEDEHGMLATGSCGRWDERIDINDGGKSSWQSTISFDNVLFSSTGEYKLKYRVQKGTSQYFVYDETVHNVNVTVTMSDDQPIISQIVIDGKKDVNSPSADRSIDFGRFVNVGVDTFTITAQHNFVGRESVGEKVFFYELYRETKEKGRVLLARVTNDGNNIVFPEIVVESEFSQEGDYNYVIKEQVSVDNSIAKDINGKTVGTPIIYSRDEHKLTVGIKKDDMKGKMAISSIILDDENKPISDTIDVGTFVNVLDYSHNPATITLSGLKELNGGNIKAYDKQFEFLLSNGSEALEIANNNNNNICFKDIRISTEGKYVFTVSENEGTASNVKYDSNVHSIEVEVENHGSSSSISSIAVDGKKTGITDGTRADVDFGKFINSIKYPDCLTITAECNLNNRELRDQEFCFELNRVLNNGSLQYVSYTKNKGSQVEFPVRRFNKEGEYKYQISEYLGTEDYVIYSQIKHELIVKVENEFGKYVVTSLQLDGKPLPLSDSVNVGKYINTYNPDCASVELILSGEKNIEGADITELQSAFGFELRDQYAVISTTSNVGKNITFNRVLINAPGRYEFTVQEEHTSSNASAYSVECDNTTHNIIVDVSAENDGKLCMKGILVDGDEAQIQRTVRFGSFTNRMYQPAKVKLSGKVIATTDILERSEFVFEAVRLLPRERRGLISYTVSDSKGNFEYNFTFNKEGRYSYEISEQCGILRNINYSAEKHTVEFTVSSRKQNSGLTEYYIDSSEECPVLVDGKKVDINEASNSNAETLIPIGDFTNDYDDNIKTANLDLEGSKTLLGGDIASDSNVNAFNFEVIGTKNKITATNNNADRILFNEIGFRKPGEYSFSIKETQGDLTGIKFDDNSHDVWVNVVTDPSEDAGVRVADVKIDGETVAIRGNKVNFGEFINKDQTKITLAIVASNSIVGKSDNKEEFIFDRKDEGTDDIKSTVTSKGESIHFESISFEEKGKYHYEFSERPGFSEGIIYSTAKHTLDVEIDEDTNKCLSIKSIKVDGIEIEPTDTVCIGEFINIYDPTHIPAKLKLSASTILKNADINDYEIYYGVFDLEDVLQSAKNDGDSIEFPELCIYSEGTYDLEIRGIKDKNKSNNIIFDTKVYSLSVHVTYNGNTSIIDKVTIDGKPVFADSNGKYYIGSFENEFTEYPYIDISAKKALVGASLNSGQFEFHLKEDGLLKEKSKNDANGNITFDRITYTEAGVYKYEVNEQPGNNPDIEYDNRIYQLEIDVIDEASKIKIDKVIVSTPANAEADSTGTSSNAKADSTSTPVDTTPRNSVNVGTFTNRYSEASSSDAKKSDKKGQDSGSDSGAAVTSDFEEPRINIFNDYEWIYAICANLEVYDPADSMYKGVTFSVFSDIEGSGQKWQENGHTVYSKDTYTGKSTLLRKRYYGTQFMALSILPPDTDVYIQYKYDYLEETVSKDSEGNDIIEQTKKSVISDITKYHTRPSSMSDLKTVKMEWVETFANAEQSIKLEDVLFNNTSAYIPDDAPQFDEYGNYIGVEDEYENFILNTLPYINKAEFTFTPIDENGQEKGESLVLNMNSSIIAKAIQESATVKAGTVWTSESKLSSNTKYKYSVRLFDKYKNEIPGTYGDGCSRILFTRKTSPVVTITEQKNTTDGLTLSITVNDKDKSIDTAVPLTLNVIDSKKLKYLVYGELDGKVINQSTAQNYLELSAPEDGKTYTVKLTSLRFGESYSITVSGQYNPKPDNADDKPDLEHITKQFGALKVFTESLGSGNIGFDFSAENISESSADLAFTMNENTTVQYAGLIDQLDFTVKNDTTRKVVDTACFSIKYEDLQDRIYDIDFGDDNRYVLDPGSPVTPKVELRLNGTILQTKADTLWDALIINYDDSNDTWSTPLSIVITLPDGSLSPFTKYSVSADAFVNKASVEGMIKIPIPSTTVPGEFSTRKTPPKVTIGEFFCMGQSAKIQDLEIYDPDDTIIDKVVSVNVYYPQYSEIYPIVSKTIYASKTPGIKTTLQFDGLAQGREYRIEIKALKYNDVGGLTYDTNVFLTDPIAFLAGSSVESEFELKSLAYTNGDTAGTVFDGLTLTSDEILDKINDKSSGWSKASNYIDTGYISVDSKVKFLRIPDFSYAYTQPIVYMYYYYTDQSNGKLKQLGLTELHRLDSSPDMIFTVPEGTEYLKLRIYVNTIPDIEAFYYSKPQQNVFSEEGAMLKGAEFYTADKACYVNSDGKVVSGQYAMLHMLPVEAGQIYSNTYRNNTNDTLNIVYWTKDKTYMGQYVSGCNSPILIPESAAYMSVYTKIGSYTTYHQLHLVGSANTDDGLTAVIGVSMNCNPDFFEEGKEPYAVLYNADSVREPNYKQYDKISLIYKGGNKWVLPDGTKEWIHSNISSKNGWKGELHMIYNGADLVVKEISFRTDGEYVTIRNNLDFRKISSNPFANFVVTEDIDYTISLASTIYGTVDFQGHKVIKRTNTVLFDVIYPSANVLNIIEEIPDGVYDSAGLFNTNYGQVNNFIWRSLGESGRTHAGNGILGGNNYGTISNFMVELGGNYIWHRSTGSATAALIGTNYGTIEQGYFYGNYKDNGERAAWIFGDIPQEGASVGTFNPRFISAQYGTVRNIYMLTDIYYVQKGAGLSYGPLFIASDIRGTYEGIYFVGDMYKLADDGSRTNMLFEKLYDSKTNEYRTYDTLLDTNNDNVKCEIKDFYHITQKNYQIIPSRIETASYTILRDSDWQHRILGEGFTVDENINKGFYPRLTFPEYMAGNQPYIDLPQPETYGTPAIMSDGWADGEYYKVNAKDGNIKIRFRNNVHYAIQSITIPGLDTSEVLYQGMAADGLWDVIIHAKVDENDLANLRYASSYDVTDFVYGPSTGKKETTSYTTSGFEFWYEIRSASDWVKIDSSAQCMTWNYRVMNNFSLRGVAENSMRISFSNSTSKDNFTGKIDGQGYTISDIDLSNNQIVPGVIARISKAEIKNLVIDGMKLNCSTAVASDRGYTGFISYADNSVISNVHVINSTIHGIRYMGSVVGYAKACRITDCSARNTTLNDHNTMNPLYMGGIVGYADTTIIASNYTRDIGITADESLKEYASGGLAGAVLNCYVKNCYAHGTMYVKGDYVGGLIGRTDAGTPGSSITNCWTGVDIESTGTYIGGISGQRGLRAFGNFAFGTVVSSGQNIHRLFGNAAASFATNQNNCAYKYQVVTDIEEGVADDAYRLLDGDELENRYIWADLMGFNTYWKLSDINEGICPRVLKYDESGELVPGQEIPVLLPGAGGNHRISVTDAQYYSNQGGLYSAVIRWMHPGYTTDELKTMFNSAKNGAADSQLTITINGLDCSNQAWEDGDFYFDWKESSTIQNATYLTICNKKRNYILDEYKLTISYKTKITDSSPVQIPIKCVQMIKYNQAPLYNVVPTYEVWMNYMNSGHGNTGENFMIVGKIDFNGLGAGVQNLNVGRLEGSTNYTDDKGDVYTCEDPGFYNINYTAGQGGEPWIESAKSVSNLTFADINVDLSTGVTTNRSASGFIMFTNSVSDVNLNGIVILTSDYTASYSGFFSTVAGMLERVEVNGLYMTRGSGTTSMNYAGGVAAEAYDGFKDVYVQNIEIDLPENYLGGFIGTISDPYAYKKVSTSKDLSDPAFDGKTTVGTVITGKNGRVTEDGRTVKYKIGSESYTKVIKRYKVKGNMYVGGMASRTKSMNNILCEGIEVSGQKEVGGMFYCSQYNYYPLHIVVKDSIIKANGGAGGLAYNLTSTAGSDMSVIGCTIDILDEGRTDMDGTFTGGVFGYEMPNGYGGSYFSIRDSLVRGYGYVGGICGRTGASAYRGYVAEDVTVISLRGYAGGAIGSTDCYSVGYNISGFDTGATVIAYTKGAGGIIGYAQQGMTMSQCYCNSKVTGATYVGGLIGFCNSSDYYSRAKYRPMRADLVKNCIVAGTFTATSRNGKASVWTNYSRDGEVCPDTGEIRYQDCAVAVWDKTVLNGRIINTDKDSADCDLPMSGRVVTSEDLRRASTYTEMGFTTTYFDLDCLDKYMPFLKYNKAVIRYANADVNGNPAGIPLPEYGVNPDQIFVYPSDADTVNIEVGITDVYEPSIPSTYQQVKYLHSDGQQVINTEVIADGDTGFVITAAGKNTRSSSLTTCKINMGESNSSSSYYLSLDYTGSSRKGQFVYGSTSVDLGIEDIGSVNTFSFTPGDDANKAVITKNGTFLADMDHQVFNSGYNVYLFRANNYNSTEATMDLYYAEIIKDGETVRKYYPVYRKSDGVAGLYDVIHGYFHVNTGKGSFTVGDNVDPTPSTAGGTIQHHSEVEVKIGDDSEYHLYSTANNDFENGVLTIGYDYKSPIYVRTPGTTNETKHTADSMRRTLSLLGTDINSTTQNSWYYLEQDDTDPDKNVLKYGCVNYYNDDIPEEYAQVEYIDIPRGGYIDLLSQCYTDSVFELDVALMGTSTSNSRIFGSYSDIRDAKGIVIGTTGSQWYVGGGRQCISGGSDIRSRTKISIQLNQFNMGGIILTSTDKGASIGNDGYSLLLGACRYKGTPLDSQNPSRWYGFKQQNMLEGTLTTIRNMVPVYRKADMVAGMLDITKPENPKFYQNSGTGTITYGPGVNESNILGETVKLKYNSVEESPINIWGNKVLTDKGHIFELKCGKANTSDSIAVYKSDSRSNYQKVDVHGILTETMTIPNPSTDINLDVYRNFTLRWTDGAKAQAERIKYRIYNKFNLEKIISPYDDIVPDGMVLNYASGIAYFATLSLNGDLRSDFYLHSVAIKGIKEISNSFYGAEPIMLIRYNDDSVIVVNYDRNLILRKTEAPVLNMSFGSYALTKALKLFSATPYSEGGIDDGTEGTADGDGTNLTGSLTKLSFVPLMTVNMQGAGTLVNNDSSIAVQGVTIASGKTEEAGTSYKEGSSTEVNDDSPEYSGDKKETVGAGTKTDGEGASSKYSAEYAVSNGDTDGESVVFAKESKVPIASAVYVEGEGIVGLDGNLIAGEEEISYVKGEGIYVNGNLQFYESLLGSQELNSEIGETILSANETTLIEYEQTEQASDENNNEAAEDSETYQSSGEAAEDSAVSGLSIESGTGNDGVSQNYSATGISTVEAGQESISDDDQDKYATDDIVLLVNKDERDEQNAFLMGETVSVYNPVSGQYEMVASNELVDDTEGSKELSDDDAEEKEELEENDTDETADEDDEKFTINSFKHQMTETEKEGMTFIWIAAAIIVGLLAAVYFILIRKKRGKGDK